jgi:hypothetical protein
MARSALPRSWSAIVAVVLQRYRPIRDAQMVVSKAKLDLAKTEGLFGRMPRNARAMLRWCETLLPGRAGEEESMTTWSTWV